MPASATFLHITDAHIAAAGTEFRRDDHKVEIPGISHDTREAVLDLSFGRLADRLKSEGPRLGGILFSGDAQNRGLPGGHEKLLDLILKHFGPLEITADKIVSCPGNHDVPRGSGPGSKERYEPFRSVWGKAGCVVPWLDGIDAAPAAGVDGPHRLLAPDKGWAVYPLNTSNWSHVTSVLPEPLRDGWNDIPKMLGKGDAEKERKVEAQLEALTQYDMARISSIQLEAMKTIIASTPRPTAGPQLRIVMMHHHLRSPTLREEVKPFADMSNLEQVRAFLRDNGIGVVVHGHKHEHAAYFDHIPFANSETEHRTLVISGATFEPGREHDAVRLITVSDLPYTPKVEIEPVPLQRGGSEAPRATPMQRKLWSFAGPADGPVMMTPGAPVVIEGSVLDQVYERACKAASAEAQNGTLIVHLDLPDDGMPGFPMPTQYPAPLRLQDGQRRPWLSDLVNWWQLGRSRLEHRIPYMHGVRLRRYGGKVDQIDRIIRLLKTKPTTRALAVLVDPFRDFGDGNAREDFASFCLVEFRRNPVAGGRITLDAIAFYRAQEFARWWPINVAEIRSLQREICGALNFVPGRITTITADARTISRSPTQVSVPIIDRWLDQAPERLHLLANALAYREARSEQQQSVLQEWIQTLDDLHASTREFNADGVPVAIEGLQALASYLDVTGDPADAELKQLARRLRDLATTSETFEKSGREKGDFDRWTSTAKGFVDELQALTQRRLQTEQKTGATTS